MYIFLCIYFYGNSFRCGNENDKNITRKFTKILLLFHPITEMSLHNGILSGGPYRHVIHGPSPLNAAHLEFLPRLSAAIQVGNNEHVIGLNCRYQGLPRLSKQNSYPIKAYNVKNV